MNPAILDGHRMEDHGMTEQAQPDGRPRNQTDPSDTPPAPSLLAPEPISKLPLEALPKAQPTIPTIDVFGPVGADVSQYQDKIDWIKFAADKRYVFIRASFGIRSDERFKENWDGAKAVGITRGAYHYFDPTLSINTQIRLFVTQVGTLRMGDLPPVVDIEVPRAWLRVRPERRVPMLMKWLQAVEDAYGIKPIVYLSPMFVDGTLGTKYAEPLKDYRLWVSHYETRQPKVPAPWPSYFIWQFSKTGACGGVVGYCDQNIFPGKMDELLKHTLSADIVPKAELPVVEEETLLPQKICRTVTKRYHRKRFTTVVCVTRGAELHGKRWKHKASAVHAKRGRGAVHHEYRRSHRHCYRGRCR